MAEPKIKVIGNLGDQHPLDYGGFIIYEVKTDDKTSIEAEVWPEPDVHKGPYGKETEFYEVHRFTVEKDAAKDLSWVTDWEAIGDFVGTNKAEILSMAKDKNPLERAHVYRMVGDHSGWENIDGYPITLTREEMEKRWPEFK